MSEITAAMVRELREMTGAGMMDCKNALKEAGGDMEVAKDLIRKKGLAKAEKKSSRTASEGRVGVYLHFTGKTASMLELRCETDFVARNEKFQELANDLAMHVMALSPRYVMREEVPEAERKREEEVILGAEDMQKKPEAAREKILEGRMRKFYETQCLIDQVFVKAEDGKTVAQLLQDAVASMGENIQVGRFERIEVGV